jgi:2-amino-4-hydroxy-6-hydroxymethyldihydropteridine diphosphokinase
MGPRRLDVDVILVEAEEVDAPDLVVPHPALLERAYLLAGTAWLVPLWLVKREGLAVGQLAEGLLPPIWARPAPSTTAAAGRPTPG